MREAFSKIFSLFKVYASAVEQDILKGKGARSIKGGVITPDILAFAASSLIMLEQAVNVFLSKIDRNLLNPHSIIENEALQTKGELKNLTTRLYNKVTDILRDIVLVDKCNKLRAISWDSEEESSFPTAFSTQILVKIKSVHKKVSNYLPQEYVALVFTTVLNDLMKYYLTVFEEIEVKNSTMGERIEKELKYFVENLEQVEIFESGALSLDAFQEKIGAISKNKCSLGDFENSLGEKAEA